MSGYIITRPRDGFQFRLIASHTSCAPLEEEPRKHPDCEGCGTKRKVASQ
jgi:hypothetical protein